MPNYCQNSLILRHKDPAMIKKAETAFDNDVFLRAFIPIPDDCVDTYQFACDNWGTKWDVLDAWVVECSDSELSVGFDTAWSPPIEAYQKLEEMGFDITAYYYESGLSFCGSYINGKDEYYNIDGDSNWVIANIPREIDDEFAISDNMAEYESEEEIKE